MKIRVTPNAKKDELFYREEILCAKVAAPAEDGKANRRLVELLENRFRCRVTITSGEKSRDKTVELSANMSQILRNLETVEHR